MENFYYCECCIIMLAKSTNPHRSVGRLQIRVGSKKHALSLSKGSSSPVLSYAEGKATASFRRGAYFQYVSTGKWRERRWWLFSTDLY